MVDTADPVQRKRITEAERRQRRADRKEAEQEARRRRRDAQFIQDADEERLLEEEEARRKEEKRRLKEEKKAAKRAEQALAEEAEPTDGLLPPDPAFTASPARDGRGPMPEEPVRRDRRSVPRIFLILSAVLLSAALLVGGSYLLWKLDVVELSVYDELAAGKNAAAAQVPGGENGESLPADSGSAERPNDGSSVPCTGITLGQTSLSFDTLGAQTQIDVTLSPAGTTDERSFSSSDESVVKVSPVGIVTVTGSGSAVITVRCGSQSAECAVSCELTEEPVSTAAPLNVTELELVKDDMTFNAAGENFVLSVTNIPVGTPVEWKSLDEEVCTVDAGGHVVAVGPGTTRVFATVGDLEAFCWVRCRFE